MNHEVDERQRMLEQAQLGWQETSERCIVLLDALKLIMNSSYCPSGIRTIAKRAINWTPGSESEGK